MILINILDIRIRHLKVGLIIYKLIGTYDIKYNQNFDKINYCKHERIILFKERV